MSDEVGITYGMTIGKDAEGRDVVIGVDFFQQMLKLIERTGGTTENLVPRTYYAASEPSGAPEGSIWFDTDDPNRATRRLTSGVWQPIADRTAFNSAAGLTPGATISLEAGGSPPAAGQPVTMQIADGDVLSWGPYDAAPTLFIDAAPLPALAAGESYELAITGVTASGGTASLKKRTTGGTYTGQTGSTRTVNNTDPGEVEVEKPTVSDAYNGTYSFALTGFIEGELIPAEDPSDPDRISGSMTIEVYYRTTAGGAWSLGATKIITATSDGVVALSQTIATSGFPAIGQHASTEFKVLCSARTHTGSRITDVTQISYTTISGGSTSTATPSGQPKLNLRIDPA